jgi:hypothetical protein
MRKLRVTFIPWSGPTAAVIFMLALAQISAGGALAQQVTPEQHTAQTLDAVRADPLALRDFLLRMPKGADLHNHLDGAIYAETFIRVGGEDGLCVDTKADANRSRSMRARSRSSFAKRAMFRPPTFPRTNASTTH